MTVTSIASIGSAAAACFVYPIYAMRRTCSPPSTVTSFLFHEFHAVPDSWDCTVLGMLCQRPSTVARLHLLHEPADTYNAAVVDKEVFLHACIAICRGGSCLHNTGCCMQCPHSPSPPPKSMSYHVPHCFIYSLHYIIIYAYVHVSFARPLYLYQLWEILFSLDIVSI